MHDVPAGLSSSASEEANTELNSIQKKATTQRTSSLVGFGGVSNWFTCCLQGFTDCWQCWMSEEYDRSGCRASDKSQRGFLLECLEFGVLLTVVEDWGCFKLTSSRSSPFVSLWHINPFSAFPGTLIKSFPRKINSTDLHGFLEPQEISRQAHKGV